MNNDICFSVDNIELFTEKILVEFDVPIFFVCKDKDGNRYSVLCVDYSNGKYIVISSSAEEILDVLSSKVPIRELFLARDTVWVVEAKEDYIDDVVYKIHSKELKDDELPKKGAYFELSIPEIKDYVEVLEKEITTSLFRNKKLRAA